MSQGEADKPGEDPCQLVQALTTALGMQLRPAAILNQTKKVLSSSASVGLLLGVGELWFLKLVRAYLSTRGRGGCLRKPAAKLQLLCLRHIQ